MLHFFQFDILEEDDFSLTLEAMASVHPPRWPAVLQEADQLLSAVRNAFGTPPGPLDDGHAWDAWVQYQAGQQAPSTTLGIGASAGALVSAANPLAPSDWLTITLTLTVITSEADVLRGQLLESTD